jgi:NADH dehydrogenase FAD-containing subunit
MKVVILGGGYAGVACATRLAQRARKAGRAVDITLVNASDRFVERIRLHQAAAGQPLAERSLSDLLGRAGVRLVVGVAQCIDADARTVRIGDQTLAWDRLVLALGSRAGRFDVPGAAEHTAGLQPDSVPVLAARLQSLPAGAQVVIVGGGLTGIEAAAEIKETYPALRVSLLSRGRIADGWSADARSHLLRAFGRLDVQLHEGIDVQAVHASRLDTSHGERPFDVCVWSAGFELPALPRESGLAVNALGQIRVDPQLRSISHPHVYAAGDLAAPVLDPGQPLPLGCKSALPSGAHVADNLARELAEQPPAAFDYAVPFFCVSLGRRDGLIQWPDADGRLLGRALTGRRAAWFKEMICKVTWWSLVEESYGFEAVKWMRTGRAPQRLSDEALEAMPS